MLAPLLLAALAAVPHLPAAEQEHDAAAAEKVSDEVYATSKQLCAALRARDTDGITQLFAHDFTQPGETARALIARYDGAAIVRRCKLKPFELTTDAKHARAVARLTFVVDGLGRDGARFADQGDVEALLVREGKDLRFAKLELQPRTFTAGGAPEFTDVTRDLGVATDFAERPPTLAGLTGALDNGGLAIADYDGDGDLDLYVVRDGANLLYRNDGDGGFTEVARAAGVADPGNGRGAIFVDLDNDGDLDLFVTNRGEHGRGNRLYRNDGNGHFTDVTAQAGVGQVGPYTSVAAADVDGDGLIDLYVTQYQEGATPGPQMLDAHNGRPNLLLHNLGNLRFEDVAKSAGVAGHEWSYAAAFADLDGDRKPELVVVNDWGSPRLYKNASTPGHVRFEDVTERAGLVDPGNGMGVDIADYDGDGRPDIHVAKMYSTAGNRLLSQAVSGDARWLAIAKTAARGDSLFHNDGDLHFSEVGDAAGIRRAGWAWGCQFADVDDDGRPDLSVTNGFKTGPLEDDL